MSQLNPAADSGHEPLLDVWREKHPDTVGHYTYYSYRFKCREKGIGNDLCPKSYFADADNRCRLATRFLDFVQAHRRHGEDMRDPE